METLATDLGTLITSAGSAISSLCTMYPLNLFVAAGIGHIALGVFSHGKGVFAKK